MDPVHLMYLAIAQIVLTTYGTMASVNAQKQAMAYQVMQHELQQKQYKDQADSEALKTLMDENDRKKKYLSQIDENRALLSITGTTADSASYRAFFKAGKAVVKSDLEKTIKNFISTEICWLPINSVEVKGEELKTGLEFLEELEEDDDVQNVYTNLTTGIS